MRLTMIAAASAFAIALTGAAPRPVLAQRATHAWHVHRSRSHHARTSHPRGAHERPHRTHVAMPRIRPSHVPAYAPAIDEPRDARGRIRRSRSEKDAFERATGHPHGWPGHVVDHVVPLACGGADDPSNMQWQTIADGKAKDRVERKGCATHGH